MRIVAAGENSAYGSFHGASVELPLDDYGRALISYSGTGTVTRDDGSSNALTFNAAQFPDGRIVVLGHYANDNAFRWFGGGDQSEPTGFAGVTPEGWTLTSAGNARTTNYLPKMTIEGSDAALRLNQLECSRLTTLAVTGHRFGLVNRSAATWGRRNRSLVFSPSVRNEPAGGFERLYV